MQTNVLKVSQHNVFSLGQTTNGWKQILRRNADSYASSALCVVAQEALYGISINAKIINVSWLSSFSGQTTVLATYSTW